MGDLFSSGSQTTTQKSEPWGPQAGYLKDAFGAAQNLYKSQAGTPWYQGDLYAGMDGLTDSGIQNLQAFANGQGSQMAGQFTNAGLGMFGAGQQGLGMYDQLAAMAGQDPTKANIAAAGQYADNPYMSGMIDAASRDVTRNLFENQIPGLNMAATGSGNMNSSRAGVAEGIMKRGAADQIGDISANMRGSAYSQGLGLAEGARTSNMGALGAAGAGYGSMFGQGLGAASTGYGMNINNADQLIRGGQLNQEDEQGQLNADFAKWQGQDNRGFDLLNKYYGIIGGNNWGGTQTVKSPSASPFQQLLGAASTAAGAYMAFSDPRLKTKIERTGEFLNNGLALYSFEYRQDPHLSHLNLPKGQQFGVMADEAARVAPHAVSISNGYLQVDYGKLR